MAHVTKGVYHADSIDVFAAGCFLFQLVVKCEPFRSADIKDEHHGKLAALDKKVVGYLQQQIHATLDFKGNSRCIQTSSNACSPQRTDHALCPLKARLGKRREAGK